VRYRIRVRRFQIPIATSDEGTAFNEARPYPGSKAEIADLRLQEQSKDEANRVGDFVSNRITSLNNSAITSNAVKMGLYRAAIERFSDIPAPYVRIFVDASIKAELQGRAEIAATIRALERKKEAA
jgi:hypothetical protein